METKKALGGGGALIDLGVHCIDLLQYVTGLKASGVMALCDTQTFGYEVDDRVSLVMKMDNGAHAYVDANFNIPDDAAQSRLEIYGTKGSIIADGTLGQEEVGTTKVCLAGAADYNAMQNRGIVNSYLLEPASGNMYTKEHGGIAGSKGVEYHTFMFDVEKFCNDTMASDKYLVPVLKSEMVFQPVIGNQQLRTVFEKLVAIVANDAACHPLQAEACIYEMLGILHQYSLTPTGQLTKIDKEFYQILEYINTHFAEKITAREISLQFNYNPSYFCRRFKAITGLSFVKYVQALRMEYAIKLLKEGKDEIRYIAWKCGYPDVSYFSNCFKNHFGFRPSEIYGQR